MRAPLLAGRAMSVVVLCLLSEATALGAPATEDALLGAAAAEIQKDQLDHAIARLEAAADGGDIHPDAAFSRGVAYLRRALSERGKPGDYGQAAAGFREALLLRPRDEEASLALEQTRLAVARKLATEGEQVQDTLGLGERVLLALDPWLLFWLAVAASGLTTIGLVLMRFGRGARRNAFGVASGIGGLVLLVSAPLAWLSEDILATLDLGVVIAQRAPLLDEAGRAKKGVAPLREGTEVRVRAVRGPLLSLSLGDGSTFVRADQVRRLRIPRKAPR